MRRKKSCRRYFFGGVAQLGECLFCKQMVESSSLSASIVAEKPSRMWEIRLGISDVGSADKMAVWSNGYDASLSRMRFEFNSRYGRFLGIVFNGSTSGLGPFSGRSNRPTQMVFET